MDINSVEFYTIAFVVAMALVALLMGRTEKKPPSTYIIPLVTSPGEEEAENTLILEPVDGGKVSLSRTALSVGEGETVNLVITVQEETCTIVEKKGVKKRGSVPEPVKGEAILNCLKPGHKYQIRYESQLTSSWAKFTFNTAQAAPKQVTLRY